jgi:phytoene desaturase
MARAARRLGVDIRLNEPVQRVVFEGRRAVGVETARGVTHADAVVVNADFAEAMTRLTPNHLRRAWSDERIAEKKYSCSTFMLYLGVEGEYDVDHHNIFLAEDYEGNIADIEQAQTAPENPSLYVANPARTDHSFAREGGSSLYVLVPVGHCGSMDWAAEKTRFRERVLERLEGFGFKDLRARIRYERCLTPEDWRDQFAIYRGATFNLAHGLDQMLYFRPHNRFQDFDGLYLVGGGTHPGSGLPVIYEGARITSDLVIADWRRSGAKAFGAAPVSASSLRGVE